MKTFANAVDDVKSPRKKYGTCYFCQNVITLRFIDLFYARFLVFGVRKVSQKKKICEKEEIIRFLLFFHLNKMSMMACDTNTRTLRNFYSTTKKNEKRDTWIALQVCMYIVYNVEEKNYCLMSGNIEPKMEYV